MQAILTVLIVLLAGGLCATAQGELVITREGSKQYHRAGCPLIGDAKDVLAMTRAQAEARSMKAHAGCDPANAPQGLGPSGPPAQVFIDPEGKYYHREKCASLGPSPKKVSVDVAARKYWPCRTCKPPIRRRS